MSSWRSWPATGIKFGYGPIGLGIGVLIGVTDRDGVLAGAGYPSVALGWQYPDDMANEGQARDRSVDRRVAGAVRGSRPPGRGEDEPRRRVQEAVADLRGVADRIRGYAGRDPDLNGIAAALREYEEQWAASRHEQLRKAAFASARHSMRSRGPEGRAGH